MAWSTTRGAGLKTTSALMVGGLTDSTGAIDLLGSFDEGIDKGVGNAIKDRADDHGQRAAGKGVAQ